MKEINHIKNILVMVYKDTDNKIFTYFTDIKEYKLSEVNKKSVSIIK